MTLPMVDGPITQLAPKHDGFRWYGVAVNSGVIYIDLTGNQLTGKIPAELGNLSNLQKLILRSDQLTGDIPSTLGNLSNLWTLQLNNNQLTGDIPSTLATYLTC